MGNFFDNFLSGMAFGLWANNPFTYGMGLGGFGFGFGGWNFGGFANPFPSIFPGGGYYSPNMSGLIMPSTFANPGYPAVDYAGVCNSIWDDCTNPESPYNRQMRDYFSHMNDNNNRFESYFSSPQWNFSPFYTPSKVSQEEDKDVDDNPPGNKNVNRNKKPERKNTKKNTNTTQSERTNTRQNENISQDAKELKNKWSKKQPQLTDEFYSRVIEISEKVKCSPDDLMALMNLETGRTFSPSEKCKNKKSTATGLIQFTEATAKTLGTTIPRLKQMSAVEQLDYVEKYIIHWKKEVGFGEDEELNAGDLYALVAQPANAKKEVLIVAGTDEYENNKKSWDLNNDKKITKSELGKCLDRYRA